MISKDMPIFVQVVERDVQARQEKEREKAARNYERSLESMFSAIENVMGKEAAGEINALGYTATIEGERFWRFDKYAFQPYQWGVCGDPESKWFRFAVMASASPEETKRLTTVRACDDLNDVHQTLQIAEQNRVNEEAKAVQLKIGKDINPNAMRLHGIINRIEKAETTPFDRLIIALVKFNADQQYDDDDDDESDDE